MAKRDKVMSQNFLELQNYVHSVIAFVKLTGARRVHLTGDSKIVLESWIASCVVLAGARL